MKLLRDNLRGTGRTTRMVLDAIRVAKTGKRVYIICDNVRHRKSIEKRVEEHSIDSGDRLSIRVCEPQHVGEINWETMMIKGQASNTVVFIDHLVIENRLNTAIDMLNRWNPDQTLGQFTGDVYSERELIERAIRSASSSHVSKVLMGKAAAEPRWKIVRDLFCCGSNMADRICVKYGFDPDDVVGPSPVELSGLYITP